MTAPRNERKKGGKKRIVSWKNSWLGFDRSFDDMKRRFDNMDAKLATDLKLKGDIVESRVQVKETGEAFISYKGTDGKLEHVHATLKDGKWVMEDDKGEALTKRKRSIVGANKVTLEMKGMQETNAAFNRTRNSMKRSASSKRMSIMRSSKKMDHSRQG